LERRAVGASHVSVSTAPGQGAAGVLPPSFAEKPFDVNAARLLCIAINTADYMTEEIPALQKAVAKKIDPAFAERIDFSPEREKFMDVASRVVTALANKVLGKLEPILDQITRQNWLAFKDAGDQSTYVRQIQAILQEYVPVVSSTVATPIYFRSYCDAFASAFLRSFQVMVLKLKRVGEAGAQQLFVDSAAIETALLEIPNLGASKGTVIDTFKIYRKYVETGMRRHKMLFKILSLQVKLSVAVEDFSRLLGPSASLVLFNQMLDMRGVVKAADRAQALKLAQEGGVPAICPEDEVVEQIRQTMVKEAPPPAPATQTTYNIFSQLGQRASASGRTTPSQPPPPPPPPAPAAVSTNPPPAITASATSKMFLPFQTAAKRPNPNPPPSTTPPKQPGGKN